MKEQNHWCEHCEEAGHPTIGCLTNTVSYIYWVEHPICKAKTIKPKKWSRKGECPSCGVSNGSDHNKKCNFIYLPVSKSF